MKRRTFLKGIGGIATGLTVQSVLGAEQSHTKNKDVKVAGLPRRILGRTGEKVSIVGFPGLALSHYDQERCNTGLHKAFEQGVNYFDVAPAYGKDGDCEKKMGIGLQGIDRSRIFLACKTRMRDKDGARQELERSLRRLKTDGLKPIISICTRCIVFARPKRSNRPWGRVVPSKLFWKQKKREKSGISASRRTLLKERLRL